MSHKLSRRDFSKLLLSGVAGSALGVFGSSKNAFASTKRVVVIGGGFGGAAAAKYLRKLDHSISVTLVEPKAIFLQTNDFKLKPVVSGTILALNSPPRSIIPATGDLSLKLLP